MFTVMSYTYYTISEAIDVVAAVGKGSGAYAYCDAVHRLMNTYVSQGLALSLKRVAAPPKYRSPSIYHQGHVVLAVMAGVTGDLLERWKQGGISNGRPQDRAGKGGKGQRRRD